MVENTDCTQVLVSLCGPDSLEADVSILGHLVLLEPRILEGGVLSDTEQKQNKSGALLSIEGF